MFCRRGEYAFLQTPSSQSSRSGNPRAAAHLFILKSVRRTIQLPNIHAAWLRRPSRTSRHDDAITFHERLASHSDVDELGSVVHFKLPLVRSAFLFHFNHDEGMRVDEAKLSHYTFDRDPLAAVIHTCNGVMRIRFCPSDANPNDEQHNPSLHAEILSSPADDRLP